ncbi:MAG: usg protein [Acetobacteraceae bacterium]
MNLALQLKDYRLTTAEILYRMPDHPDLLQTYVWQELDLAPEFPELRRFLTFWRRKLDGPVHSVRVAVAGPLRRAGFRHPALLRLH